MAEALTFRDNYMGIYQEVYPEPGRVPGSFCGDLSRK